jgi:hypothetical protein
MPNHFKTSSGEKVSQSVIDRRRSQTYRELYEGEPHPSCEGCGKPAQGSAHLMPQKVCKELGKAEYCWLKINIIPACNKCNSILESYKGDEVRELMCYEKLLAVTKLIDITRYLKMTL